MIKTRTLRKLKVAALLACIAMNGTVFATTCTVGDLRDNVIGGSLTAVKNYVTGFWTTLFPTLGDLITISQNNGVPIPNPPWP